VLHPATQLRYINDAIGYGVFTTAFIPRGTFVWVLDAWDRILSPPAVAALPRLLKQQVEKYAYINAAGDYVLCWDFGRYMNHSCEPTSLGLGESIEVAVRDIEPGEELTCEYAALNLTTTFACGCQKQTCRKLIGAQDLDRLWEQWDQTVAQLLPAVSQVEQPLVPFIKANERDQAVLDGIFNRTAVELPSPRDYHASKAVKPARQSLTACRLWRLD